MADIDPYELERQRLEAQQQAKQAELLAALQGAQQAPQLSGTQAIAQGVLGILPMVLGYAIAKKRGLAAGADAGALASTQYEAKAKEPGKLSQAASLARAKALQSEVTNLQKSNAQVGLAGLNSQAADERLGTQFENSKQMEGIKQGNRESLVKIKEDGGSSISPEMSFLRAKIASGEPLSDEERQVAHSDKGLSDMLVRAAISKASGGDISEMGANIRAKIANGQKLEPEEETFAYKDKDLSKLLVSSALTRQNAEAAQRNSAETATELQNLRFEQQKELKTTPGAKAEQMPQSGEQAALRAKILLGGELAPEDVEAISKYPDLAAEYRQKQGQGVRGRANKEQYERKIQERHLPGSAFVAGFIPSEKDTPKGQALLDGRGRVKQYSDKYVAALKKGNLSDQSTALANLVWTGKDIRTAGAQFTDSEQMLIRAGLPPTGEVDWTYAGARDYFTKVMQDTNNLAKIAAFVKDMNEEIDRSMIVHKYLPPGYTSQVVNVEGKRRSVVFKNGKYYQHFELQ